MRIRVALATANHVVALSIYLYRILAAERGIRLKFIAGFDRRNLYSAVEKKRKKRKKRERARGKGGTSFLTKCEFPGRAAALCTV